MRIGGHSGVVVNSSRNNARYFLHPFEFNKQATNDRKRKEESVQSVMFLRTGAPHRNTISYLEMTTIG